MKYHIINYEERIKKLYPDSIVPMDKRKFYSKETGFNLAHQNKSYYNKAGILLIESIYNIMKEDIYFSKIISNYCKEMLFTSMDRPYNKNSSHSVKDKACDFYVYPAFLMPFVFLYLSYYQQKNNSSVLISIVNRHIHFNSPSTGMSGVEVAFKKSDNKFIIPLSYNDERPQKAINQGIADVKISENLFLYSYTIMDWYFLSILVESFLSPDTGPSASIRNEIPDNDRKAILVSTCSGLGIEYEQFLNYLKQKGYYNDGYDFLKSFSPSAFIEYAKEKTVEIYNSDYANIIKVIFGGYITYKIISFIKK